MERCEWVSMGWHIAAMRSRKSRAWAEVGPGRGLRKIMREEGWGRGALRLWMPSGIAPRGLAEGFVRKEVGGENLILVEWRC